MKRLGFVLAYLVVLMLSHAFVFFVGQSTQVPGGKVEPSPVSQGQSSGSMPFISWGDEASDSASTILLLLDPRYSPAHLESWRHVFPADDYRVLLPQADASPWEREENSNGAVNRSVSALMALLDRLGVTDVHLVASGSMGPTAIRLASAASTSIRSLVLVSATATQEFELLGDHHLNHAIYWAQGLVTWTVTHLIPHFGTLQGFPWDQRWIDHLKQSDLRQIRDVLTNLDLPVLIVHQKSEARVPLEASRELHRLLPQSQLIVRQDGPDGQAIEPFFAQVDNGLAMRRADAPADRRIAAEAAFDDTSLPPISGQAFWIALILIALATLITEDLTCISAGLMVSRGLIGFVPATLATLIGIFVGDILLFLAGRWIGKPALTRVPLKWLLDESDIERCGQWLDAKGPSIIIASRFLPGSRLPTYFGAGMMGAGFWMFTAFFLLACVMWTPILVGLSALVGKELLSFFSTYERLALPLLLATVALLWIASKIILPLTNHKGRRLLRAAWIRKTRWEFWSPLVFYIPLAMYILYLGIRFRCMTLFTASNPGIPSGGFIGESKSFILTGLAHAGVPVARFVIIEADPDVSTKVRKVRYFMEQHELDFPIVLKPDVGERGRGVAIIKDRDHLKEYLSRMSVKTIAQEYVSGHEYGIFYVRFPEQAEGRIFSITDKRFPALTGDGKHTLEELILRHERAMVMAPTHMKTHSRHLFRIPRKDQKIPLVEVGTHCRGAIFLDGNYLKTKNLERAIDRISQSVDGFYFGRYDIRCPSAEALQRGENLTVVELNGVTSEATHIYDPSNGLLSAYRVLASQWKLAFQIGAENRKRGVQPTRVRHLLRSVSTRLSSPKALQKGN